MLILSGILAVISMICIVIGLKKKSENLQRLGIILAAVSLMLIFIFISLSIFCPIYLRLTFHFMGGLRLAKPDLSRPMQMLVFEEPQVSLLHLHNTLDHYKYILLHRYE